MLGKPVFHAPCERDSLRKSARICKQVKTREGAHVRLARNPAPVTPLPGLVYAQSASAGSIDKVGKQMVRKIALAGVAALSLAACTAHEQRVGTGAGLGAGAGAIAGAAITGDVEGALLGAAAGAAAGAIIGHVTDRPGYCYARDQYGQTVVVQCPQGY